MSDIHEPVNIGNPDEQTIMDLTKIILRLSNSQSKIVHCPLPMDDPKIRQPSIGTAKKMLGWQPQVKLEEGLRITVDWFREKLGDSF